jgi:hypothetical protein
MQVMQNFIKCGQIRVLITDNVNFRDYIATVMDECMDVQHWSDTDRGELKYFRANLPHSPTVNHKPHLGKPSSGGTAPVFHPLYTIIALMRFMVI